MSKRNGKRNLRKYIKRKMQALETSIERGHLKFIALIQRVLK